MKPLEISSLTLPLSIPPSYSLSLIFFLPRIFFLPLFTDEDLIDDERDWIQLDKMLSPHAYTSDELLRGGSLNSVEDRDVFVDLSTSILAVGKLKGIVNPTKRVLAERKKTGFEQRFLTKAQKLSEHLEGDHSLPTRG